MASPGVPEIRPLTPGDLDNALALSETAGWNQRLEDWRMLLRTAPAGAFGAIHAGRLVGTAIGIDYGGFGWIAMMLVDPAYRSRGLGARLLESAMGAIPAERPIRLDATPAGRPLYERYGFGDEAVLSRQVAAAADRGDAAGAAVSRSEVRPMAASDVAAVADHDEAVFGGRRREVLEWALDGAPHYAWMAAPDSGSPQYCFGRRGRLFDQIGPVVARDPAIAAALAGAALRHAGDRPIAIDAFDAPTAFTAWLREAGFAVQRPLFRMCRPAGTWAPAARRCDGPSSSEFAILGPEFA